MSAGDWKDMLAAVQKGDIALVKYHIENDVDPNYEHPEFFTTPLIESVSNNRLEITKYLLQHGADPELEAGFSSNSPLQLAKELKSKEMIKLIESHMPRRRKTVSDILRFRWC